MYIEDFYGFCMTVCFVLKDKDFHHFAVVVVHAKTPLSCFRNLSEGFEGTNVTCLEGRLKEKLNNARSELLQRFESAQLSIDFLEVFAC